MTPRARASAALLALALAAPRARATSGTALAETSRTAALANAVSARPGDAGSMLLNPAGLADVERPMVLLTGHFARLEQSFTRTSEPSEDRGRWLGGFGLAAATPLPGPLSLLRLGFALDTPAEHALRVAVPTRLDAPASPYWDGRPDRISASFTGAIALSGLKLGGGVAITPDLDTPTDISYVAGRDKSLDKSVVIRLDRTLRLGVSPFFGMRLAASRWLALAVVYRGASVSIAKGSQRTVAGGILADDPIDFYQMWDPGELVFGTALGPWKDLTASFDVTAHFWSEMKTGFDTVPDPKLRDTVSLRGGLEYRGLGPQWLTLRGGWAVEPSPIPEQTHETNFLGSSDVVLAGGVGLDLRKAWRAPVLVDVHVRTILGKTESAHKDPNALPDASADLPGKQIDNLGYPAFRSSATVLQLGATVTLLLGSEPKEARR